MDLNQVYTAVLDAVDDPLLVVAGDGAVAFSNTAASAFFAIGEAGTLEETMCVDERIVFDGAEVTRLAAAGAAVRGHGLVDRDGSDTGISLDVVPVAAMERALAVVRVRHDAGGGDFWKDDMISMVSHEIKNPLSAMKNSVDILLSQMPGELTAGQRRFLDTSGRSIDRLTHMLDGFLDVSRIRSGAFELQPARTDIRDFLEDVMDSFATLFNVTRVTLDWDVDGDVVDGWFDAPRVEQVLVNLLSNALKFTPEGGGITVRARAGGIECVGESLRLMPWAEIGTPRIIEFEVRDTGIGMTGEKLDSVFDRFGSDPGPGAHERGTHLGLNISRALTQAQGGWLEVSSTLGIGTTVKVRLPGDRRAAVVLSRLGQVSTLLDGLRARRRPAGVFVLGKELDDDWTDVAQSWGRNPAVNPDAGELTRDGFYLWTLSSGMAVAVATQADQNDPMSHLFSARFVACEENAFIFPSWAVGRSQSPDDAMAAPQLIGIATSRMGRARKVLAKTALESLDSGIECIRTEWQVEP
jgi:signal transduction histidine kinase